MQRYANLIKDGSITQQQYDQAKSDLEVATSKLSGIAKDQYKAADCATDGNTTRDRTKGYQYRRADQSAKLMLIMQNYN
jgi:membrane fusion protein (multidrug efflux system)